MSRIVVQQRPALRVPGGRILGLPVYYAKGGVIDMTQTLRAFPVGTLHSVRRHLQP